MKAAACFTGRAAFGGRRGHEGAELMQIRMQRLRGLVQAVVPACLVAKAGDCLCQRDVDGPVITSYSIHYTKLYESPSMICLAQTLISLSLTTESTPARVV